MYGQQQPRRNRAGGVILVLVIAIAVLAWIGHSVSQSATITTCTNPGTAFASCSQQVVPVSTQAP